MAKLKKNPRATVGGAAMGTTMCTCGHMYVEHIEKMPSPAHERKCRECPCAQFSTASDEQVRAFDKPEKGRVVREYTRLSAAHMLEK